MTIYKHETGKPYEYIVQNGEVVFSRNPNTGIHTFEIPQAEHSVTVMLFRHELMDMFQYLLGGK